MGVRRTPEQLGHLNPKKPKIDHSDPNHPMIPKGTTVYRTTHGKKDILETDIYVSWTENDRNFYRKNWGTTLGDMVVSKKVINDGYNFKSYDYKVKDYTSYEQEYKLSEDLKVASYADVISAIQKARNSMTKQERFNMYKDIGKREADEILYERLYYGDKDRINRVNSNTKIKSELINEVSKEGKSVYAAWKDGDNKSLTIDMARSWAWQIGSSETLRSKVTSELAKQGYNSCVDVAGVGSRRSPQGVDPIIVFSSKSLEKQNVVKYTEDDRKKLPDYNAYKDNNLATDWDKLENTLSEKLLNKNDGGELYD